MVRWTPTVRGGGELVSFYAKEPELAAEFAKRYPNAKQATDERGVERDCLRRRTIGMGPHRIHPPDRPAWFWDPAKYGGIICDIGSHQFDQFLFFTGSTRADIVASQVRNAHHPEHPAFQDFGDVMVHGNGGTGYIRLDWFTPAGLPTWGDGRLTVLGTDGYIEARKYVDIGGREGGSHLFIVDAKGVRHIDCTNVELPYGRQLVDDVLNRTETAMPQAHCFLAMELAIRAQKQARVV